MTVPVFPDIELLLLYALVPLEPDIRFVTRMPTGDLAQTTALIHRISGANRNIGIDRPIVDIDVFGIREDAGNVSIAARNIQSDILSLMGVELANGVIQHVTTVNGPRTLPEDNPYVIRFSATYELQVHP
jgi:hypothetical protein